MAASMAHPVVNQAISRCVIRPSTSVSPEVQAVEPDRSILAKVLQEPAEYVAHALFEKPNVERLLFGGTARFDAKGSCFREPPMAELADDTEPTLTTAQEILLFQRFNYARLRIARIIQQYGSAQLPPRAVRELLAWGHRATEARTRIVRSNMALVLAMAKRTRLNGLDYNELISEGNLALLRSVEKFDCSRGFKFSTYACRAILKSFSRVAMRASRYRVHFPTEYDPTMEKSDVVDTKHTAQEDTCIDEIRDILARNKAELNDMEQRVIRERFALDAPPGETTKGKTLEQVGALIGVTKERVRQIQNKALAKLRMILDDNLAA